jgi:single-strand DNA-binding protein
MNSTHHIGRLTADPEPLKTTPHGSVTTFRIAVPRPNGATKEADFFTVEAWKRLAETCVAHLARGREIAVDGRLDQREWRDAEDRVHERVVIVARSIRFLREARRAGSDAADEDVPF